MSTKTSKTNKSSKTVANTSNLFELIAAVRKAFDNIGSAVQAAQEQHQRFLEVKAEALQVKKTIDELIVESKTLDNAEDLLKGYSMWPDSSQAQAVIAAREAVKALLDAWTKSEEFNVFCKAKALDEKEREEKATQLAQNRKEELTKYVAVCSAAYKFKSGKVDFLSMVSIKASNALKEIKQATDEEKATGAEINWKQVNRQKLNAVIGAIKDILAEKNINCALIPDTALETDARRVLEMRRSYARRNDPEQVAHDNEQKERREAAVLVGHFGIDKSELSAGKMDACEEDDELLQAMMNGERDAKYQEN